MSILNQLIEEIKNAKKECPYCQGCGYVQSVEWQEFWNRFQKRIEEIKRQNPDLSSLEAESRVWNELEPFMPTVSEEEPCVECEGTGFIYDSELIQLKSLLQEILEN